MLVSASLVCARAHLCLSALSRHSNYCLCLHLVYSRWWLLLLKVQLRVNARLVNARVLVQLGFATSIRTPTPGGKAHLLQALPSNRTMHVKPPLPSKDENRFTRSLT